MYEYSKIIAERRLTSEDLNHFSLIQKECYIKETVPEFTHVNKGDWVIRISPSKWFPEEYEIVADCEGYVRLNGLEAGRLTKIDSILFYITENGDMAPERWDLSSLKYTTDIIDGKYYYSLRGIPKEPIIDIGSVVCRITITNDDPEWTIESKLYCGQSTYYSTIGGLPGTNCIVLSRKESFIVKLKNGTKDKNGVTYKYDYKWEEEEDGKHYCIRNFAIGYPKLSQLSNNNLTSEPLKDGCLSCFVYIMRNNDNGAYKIGISNDPAYREHTLQSQEPNITCIFQVEFPTREIARDIEHNMHIKYAEYHMRGEWYAIPHEEISKVMLDIIKFK